MEWCKELCLVIGSRKQLKDKINDKVAKHSLLLGEKNVSVVENIQYLGDNR